MLDDGFPQKLQHVAKKLIKHSCEWQFSFPHCCSQLTPAITVMTRHIQEFKFSSLLIIKEQILRNKKDT